MSKMFLLLSLLLLLLLGSIAYVLTCYIKEIDLICLVKKCTFNSYFSIYLINEIKF